MDSQTYWKNRETEQRKHNIRDEAEYQKQIRAIYQNMIDEIEKEINGFYGKYAKKEGITMADARKRAAKADIEALGRKAAKYVKEKDFSEQANEEMRLYNMTMKVNRLEFLKAQIGLEMVAGFDELQKYYNEILTERTISEFERQAGILGKTVQNNAKAANAIVNASFHNATFSDRIWMYQGMLKSELDKLLQTGLIQGQNPRVLARHLKERFGVSQYNAERLMRTEMARVQSEASKRSMEENGFEEYEFMAEGTACPICRALDGKHFRVKDMLPGTNAAPMHPNCRCDVTPYIDRKEFENWLDFLDKGGTTEEWNKLKKKKKSVEKSGSSGMMNSSSTKEDIQVHSVGKIDRDIYKCITKDIVTDEVIITDERIEHIKERHPNDYERFYSYIPEIISNPDYIIEANKPNTAVVLKEIEERGEKFKLVLRIKVQGDPEEYKNSIMTFWHIGETTWRKTLKNKTILYKKE
jgi:SPP1 gp7 family putative phage head morphogenesis protein